MRYPLRYPLDSVQGLWRGLAIGKVIELRLTKKAIYRAAVCVTRIPVGFIDLDTKDDRILHVGCRPKVMSGGRFPCQKFSESTNHE